MRFQTPGHRLRATQPRRAWRGGPADDSRARAPGGLCPRRAGPADAAGADGRECRSGAASPRDRHPASAGDGRTGPQPRALAVRAAAGGGDRMGDGADRDRTSRRPAISARFIERSSGLLDAIEAAPSASGWGAALVRYELLLLAELGFGLDLDRCAVSGAQRQSRRGQPQVRAGGQRRRSRALCRQAACLAAFRPRGRPGELGAKSCRGSS